MIFLMLGISVINCQTCTTLIPNDGVFPVINEQFTFDVSDFFTGSSLSFSLNDTTNFGITNYYNPVDAGFALRIIFFEF
jgi:hypothetical protein